MKEITFSDCGLSIRLANYGKAEVVCEAGVESRHRGFSRQKHKLC